MENLADTKVTSQHLIKLVIFDLDGTLVDTIADLAYAVNTTLELHGWPSRDLHEIKSMVGDGFAPLVERAVPPEILAQPTLMSRVLKEASAFYTDHSVVSTSPYPDIERLLAELKERGIDCAVLSNKAQIFSSHIVAKLFPEGTFAVIQGETEGIPKKPHPQAALGIAAKLGIVPLACAVVGDSPHDMLAACSAGMLAIGAGWGYRSATELIAGGAEHVLSSPLEFLDLI